MAITTTGWKNKCGTSDRSCKCGTWEQHWLNFAKMQWPTTCSIFGCNNRATLGAHIFNPAVTGERIVPMCAACNCIASVFSLKIGTIVVNANTAETCGQ